MSSALSRIREACIDDANRVASFGKGYQEKVACGGETGDDLAHLANRVVGIVMDAGQRVEKDGHRLVEGDAVLLKVGRRLLRIPRELHDTSLRHLGYGSDDGQLTQTGPVGAVRDQEADTLTTATVQTKAPGCARAVPRSHMCVHTGDRNFRAPNVLGVSCTAGPACRSRSGAAVAANDVQRTEWRTATAVTPSRWR